MMTFDEAKSILITWADAHGFEVVIKKNTLSFVDFDLYQIYIEDSLPDDTKLFAFLHECGHIIVYNRNKRFHKHAHNKNDKAAAILIEEIDAWHAAERLAKKLKIDVDKKRWTEEMLNSIGKYISWSKKQTK